ncbi:MAG: hypothetical protein ACXAEL_13130, partial [Candidatus Hodarchaeales archaeon]
LGGFVLTQYGFSTGLFLITALFLLGVSIVGLGLYWLSRPKITDAPPIEEIEPTPQETPTQATG